VQRSNNIINIRLIAICALFLSACAVQQNYQEKGPAQPADFPEAFYLQAAADLHNKVYRADRKLSQILIRTYSGGPLALLGHEHIIASQDVQGYILLNKTTGLCQVDLFAPLDQLNVDDPQLRAEAALKTTPSPSDVEGTKNNMLKSIDATDSPFAELHSSDCSVALSGKETRVALTIHGVQQDRLLKIDVQQAQEKRLIVSGKFSILQTDFGIEPFSISNGLIKVKNKLDLTYQVVFTQIN
jgi:hypothetical protein